MNIKLIRNLKIFLDTVTKTMAIYLIIKYEN